MTEINDASRQTTMKGTEPSPSSASLSESENTDQSRGAPTTEVSQPGIPHRLPPVSDAATLNNTNQTMPSFAETQSSSMEKPLDSGLNSETAVPLSAPEALEPSSGSSFAKLAFEKFETYMNETRAKQIVPPLQEAICGYGEGLARLAQSAHHHLQLPPLELHQQPQPHPNPRPPGQFLEPIALRRHIHSTPQIRHAPISALSAIHDEDECDSESDEEDPPPAGLEILDLTRSRSTPLTTSENSAFGTIFRTNSHRVHDASSVAQASGGRSSAFSLRPYAMMKATSRSRSNERTARPVIFNPIVHEDEILKIADGDDALGEMTSIEVTNVPYLRDADEVSKRSTKKKSRAARFLTDVRNLRISSGNGGKRQGSGGRRRPRDGRENPARPASISSDEQSRSSSVASSPTARTNPSIDTKDLVNHGVVSSSIAILNHTNGKGRAASVDGNAEKSGSPIPSSKDRVCIQVNENTDFCNRAAYSMSSPERMTQSFVSPSQDSPESGRFHSSVSNASGRVSQGTSTSNSSNSRSMGSQLSVISETDREVENVNLLQRDRKLQAVGEQIELSLSSDRSIRSRDLNCSLSTTTPESRARGDGASVRADRFFNNSKDSGRFRNLPPFMKRSGATKSPTTGSSGASVNTSSSSGSDEPPKIVSYQYMDRKQVSDLSSLHHRPLSLETSSPRADHDQEVREASPSEQILAQVSEIVFEGAHGAKIDIYDKHRSNWSGKAIHTGFSRKNRSLPPRSPVNKAFTSITPPPRGGSPAHGVSPPRHIIGHRVEPMSTNVSKPYVVAPVSSHLTSAPSTELLHAPHQGSQQVVRLSPNCDYYNLKPAARRLSPVYGHQVARTYEESSIEILKTDSKEDNSIPLVTPDKGTPSS
ncbi:unnamed protein product [Pseudo-nitzschia multistriata]|uniref:Uncharacterized protein n=1 Tax=Pseudo-nitzschia multistriata TaxID=183589 RepID=A0A448ZKI9_9STRA|nr:unnamed protein product [Pseudo-nitzschia multistriata]